MTLKFSRFVPATWKSLLAALQVIGMLPSDDAPALTIENVHPEQAPPPVTLADSAPMTVAVAALTGRFSFES